MKFIVTLISFLLFPQLVNALDCIGAHISDGSPNKSSVVQVWNPINSGVTFKITQIDLAWTAIDSVASSMKYQGFDTNYWNYPIGQDNSKRFLSNKVASMSSNDCPIELRIDQWTAPYPSSKLIYENWQATLGEMRPYYFNSPIVIQPGMGLLIRGAIQNVYTILNVQGYTE